MSKCKPQLDSSRIKTITVKKKEPEAPKNQHPADPKKVQ